MNSATDTDLDAFGTLPHMGLLRFSGPDAATFLQGQVSNDTRRLGTGASLLAAYSTPQGRVAAILQLLPHSSGVIALLPREIVMPTLERLRKFVLRAKVKIEDLGEDFEVIGARGVGALRALGLAPPMDGGYVEHGGVGVARVGSADRFWVIGATPDLGEHGFTGATGPGAVDATAVGEQAWRLANVRAGWPQVYAATREMFVAQMLNLDLLDGISFSKGCYTGQEIIARTQHLGRVKRRMFRLRLPAGTWAVGQTVHLPDGRSGRLTEIAAVDDLYEALAVLNVEMAQPSLPEHASDTSVPGARAPDAPVPGAPVPDVPDAIIPAQRAPVAAAESADVALAVGACVLPLPYTLIFASE